MSSQENGGVNEGQTQVAKENTNLLSGNTTPSPELSSSRANHGATSSTYQEPPDINQTSKEGGLFRWMRDRRPYLVEIPIFFYFLAYKGALPLKEQFVYVLVTSQITTHVNLDDGYSPSCAVYLDLNQSLSNTHIQLEVLVQEESSKLLSVLNFVRNVPALFTTLIICAYTDVVGRKWGIMLPCIGGVLKSVAFLVVSYLGNNFMSLLYVGEVLEGVGGSIMTAQSCAAAYVSDINPPNKRTFRFTFIQSIHFLGTAFGNLFIGYMIQGIGYRGSYWYTTALYILCLLWVAILLPESVPKSKESSSFSITETLTGAIMVFTLYAKKSRPYLNRVILLIMLVPVIMDNFILLGRNDVDTLYMLAVPFCWTSIIIGYFQLVKYVCKALAGIGVKGLILCLQEATIGALGAMAGVAGNLLMGLARNSTQLWIVTVLSAPSAVVLPLAQAIMSQCVGADEQGQLFASLGVVEAASDMFASTVLDIIYYATFHVFPGTVFIVIAVLYLVSCISFTVTWILQHKAYYSSSSQDDGKP